MFSTERISNSTVSTWMSSKFVTLLQKSETLRVLTNAVKTAVRILLFGNRRMSYVYSGHIVYLYYRMCLDEVGGAE